MTDGERTRLLSRVFLLTLMAVLAWGVYLIMRPFLEPLVAAVILTISFFPAYDAIHRRIPNPSLAAAVCVLLLFVLILTPLVFLTITVVSEARDVYNVLQQQSQIEGGWSEYFDAVVERPVRWIGDRTGISAPDLKAALLQHVEQFTSALLRWSSSLFGNLTATLGRMLITLFVMFFFFQSGDRFRAQIADYLPMEEHRLDNLLGVMKSAIVANLYGLVIVSSMQGLLVGLGFAFTGLRSPVFWGMVACFASLIPVIGAALIWVPGALLLLFSGFWGKAIFLTLWGMIVVGLSDNVVRPLVLKRGVELSTLAIFFSLIGGLQVFGFIGLFAGPIIFTMAYVVMKILHEERLEWEGRPALVHLSPAPASDFAPPPDIAADPRPASPPSPLDQP